MPISAQIAGGLLWVATTVLITMQCFFEEWKNTGDLHLLQIIIFSLHVACSVFVAFEIKDSGRTWFLGMLVIGSGTAATLFQTAVIPLTITAGGDRFVIAIVTNAVQCTANAVMLSLLLRDLANLRDSRKKKDKS